MSACDLWSNGSVGDDVSLDMSAKRYRVSITVDDELIAAVEGWRRAHGLTEQPEALGELVRLGLMSEIAKIYQLVRDERANGKERFNGIRKRSKQGRPAGKVREAPSPPT